MSLTIEESQVQDAVLVADKGFYSKANMTLLAEKKLQYVDTIIWYFNKQINENQRVILYLDEDLRRAEQHDFLQRIEKEYANYSLENYHLKAKTHGTIALITNLNDTNTPEKIYQHYKSRAAIEILFDTFKNILFADTTYMRSNEAMEAWLFINHIALIFYYRLFKRLIKHKLLKKYSPKDILMHLNTIKKVKINDKWLNAEIATKSKAILEKLEIPITGLCNKFFKFFCPNYILFFNTTLRGFKTLARLFRKI